MFTESLKIFAQYPIKTKIIFSFENYFSPRCFYRHVKCRFDKPADKFPPKFRKCCTQTLKKNWEHFFCFQLFFSQIDLVYFYNVLIKVLTTLPIVLSISQRKVAILKVVYIRMNGSKMPELRASLSKRLCSIAH